jgi:hypothetical protein
LADSDFRKAGVWCTCTDCGKNFDVPVTENYCRNCHTTSTFEDVKIEDVNSYSLKEDLKNNSSLSWFLTTSIRQSLINHGLKIENEPFVLGKSGAKHAFSIVAYNKDPQRRIVVDIATSDTVVSEQPVISLFAKIFDVSPEKACLVAIPKLSENAKKMAELYKIVAIEAASFEEAVAQVKQNLPLSL